MNEKNVRSVRFERTYEAPIEDLWDLWTTKEGFESWWGPVGFRVDVHHIDPKVGGTLSYDMIAVGDEQVAAMKAAGMPLSHGTHGTFVQVDLHRCLTLRHVIDFIDGVEPYDNDMRVEFSEQGSSVQMTITVDAHKDAHWTEQAKLGMESQLTKLPAVLAARHDGGK